MNFKVNAWTFLFAIAAIAAIYMYTSCCTDGETDSTAEVSEAACKSCKPPPKDYKIDSKRAQDWIDEYVSYASTLKDTAFAINPNVRYFHLPRCEMVEMINEVGVDGDVIAHLAIDPEDRMIKLVFHDTPRGKSAVAESNGGGFFDFTRPCPPICDE